jgi:lysophospholipid acyltransferase (LPLAT)-like uncharacterized protein
MPVATKALVLFLRGLAQTWRTVVVGRQELLAGLTEHPAVLVFWHNRLLASAIRVSRQISPGGAQIVLMTSLSRDGELAARLAKGFGYLITRGSTSRGGMAGIRSLNRAMRGLRASVLLAPDGPRGPRYVAQPGSIVLAQHSGNPIIPLACAAASSWRVRSWDRLIIPKPFSRVVVAVGEPLFVARKQSREELSLAQQELKDRLDRAVAEAENHLSKGRPH